MNINLGKVEGTHHFFPVHVFYNMTDAGGIVYHANYLRICEEARVSMCIMMKLGPGDVNGEFVVRSAHLDYMKPAKYGDDLVIETWYENARRTSAEAVQIIRRGEDIIAKVRLVVVFVSLDGTFTPTPIPESYKVRDQ